VECEPFEPGMELVPDAALYCTELADPHHEASRSEHRLQLVAALQEAAGSAKCWPFKLPCHSAAGVDKVVVLEFQMAALLLFHCCQPSHPCTRLARPHCSQPAARQCLRSRVQFDAQAVYCHGELPSLRPLASAT
jgi:hypothetical protein